MRGLRVAPPRLRAAARGEGERLSETLRRIGAARRRRPSARGRSSPSPRPLRYRCRAKFHFDRASAQAGLLPASIAPAGPARGVPAAGEGLDALRSAVGPALATARLSPREVALEWSEREGRGAALLVLPELTPGARERAEALLAAVPALAGLVLQAEGAPSDTVGDPVLTHDRFPGAPERGLAAVAPGRLPAGEPLLERPARRRGDPAARAGRRGGAGALLRRRQLHRSARRARRSVAAVEVQGPALELARADLAGAGNVRF